MTDHAPREATASSLVRAEITEIEKAELLNAMRQATGETVTISRAAVDLCRRLCSAHDAAIAELAERTRERDREASEAAGYQKLAKEAADAEQPGILVLIVQHDGTEVRIFGPDRSAEDRFGETVARWWNLLKVTTESLRANDERDEARAERDAARAEVGVMRRTLADTEAQRDAERERFNLLSQRCSAAEAARDSYREEVEQAQGEVEHALGGSRYSLMFAVQDLIRDRNEFAASEVERFARDLWDNNHLLYRMPCDAGAAHRAAELRKAAPAAAPVPDRRHAVSDPIANLIAAAIEVREYLVFVANRGLCATTNYSTVLQRHITDLGIALTAAAEARPEPKSNCPFANQRGKVHQWSCGECGESGGEFDGCKARPEPAAVSTVMLPERFLGNILNIKCEHTAQCIRDIFDAVEALAREVRK